MPRDHKGDPRLHVDASGGPFIITTRGQSSRTSSTTACRRAVRRARRGHRLTFFAVPKSGWTVAATIERRGRWHGMADPRLHGESTGY